MGKMTVEEILQNKQKFGEEVFEIATVGTDVLIDRLISRGVHESRPSIFMAVHSRRSTSKNHPQI